jgi:hypothetical protein
MLNRSSIYGNRLFPPGLYYCKLLDCQVEHSSTGTVMWMLLRTGPSYGEFAGKLITSILYVSDKAAGLLAKFRQTFRITDEDDAKAIGRWGCVSIIDNQYKGTQFSNVIYVNQNWNMQQSNLQLEEGEKQGLLEWAVTPESPKPMAWPN